MRRLIAQPTRLRHHHTDILRRRLLHTSGRIHTNTDRVTVRPAGRTYSSALRQADPPQATPIQLVATEPSTVNWTNHNREDQTGSNSGRENRR
jgi:hypothetical protein